MYRTGVLMMRRPGVSIGRAQAMSCATCEFFGGLELRVKGACSQPRRPGSSLIESARIGQAYR